MPLAFPKLYVIIDAAVLANRGVKLRDFAEALRAGGVTLIQYRDKDAGPQTVLRNAQLIADVFAGSDATLILNDRADLALLAGWAGVHVGQEDLPPEDARVVLGQSAIIGLSTHNEAQVIGADFGVADYVAVGPVFATQTKLNAEAVVGLEGVRQARALTSKPLVAVGGITRKNAQDVLAVGANSVAVISGLFDPGESIEKVARDFLDHLR